MNTFLLRCALYLAILCPFALRAADAEAAATGTTTLNWIDALIAIVVPAVVAALKYLWPRIPKLWLPLIAPLLGIVLDQISQRFGVDGGSPLAAAVAGALGVWLREVNDQVKKTCQSDFPRPALPLFVLVVCCVLSPLGCARFATKQTDLSYEKGQPQRAITTRASGYSFFASKATLATWKASQTDKTQSASVGNLALESQGATNVQALVETVVGAAIRAASAAK